MNIEFSEWQMKYAELLKECAAHGEVGSALAEMDAESLDLVTHGLRTLRSAAKNNLPMRQFWAGVLEAVSDEHTRRALSSNLEIHELERVAAL